MRPARRSLLEQAIDLIDQRIRFLQDERVMLLELQAKHVTRAKKPAVKPAATLRDRLADAQ